MIIQSLHREDGLTKTEIGVMLGRHKSWVSRRISLITRAKRRGAAGYQTGASSVRAGRELAKLPRGNQKAAADAIFKHRFSTRETAKLYRVSPLPSEVGISAYTRRGPGRS